MNGGKTMNELGKWLHGNKARALLLMEKVSILVEERARRAHAPPGSARTASPDLHESRSVETPLSRNKSVTDLIADAVPAVCRICPRYGASDVGAGTGFLVPGGIVTNAHILPNTGGYDSAELRFHDGPSIRLTRPAIENGKLCFSPPRRSEDKRPRRDYAFLAFHSQDLVGRHPLEFASSSDLRVGDPVLYLGYPFGYEHLCAHQGSIASIHQDAAIAARVFQIDGSVNPGNSGGPMLNSRTGLVEGIVTEAETGLFLDQFDHLIDQLDRNVRDLGSMGELLQVGNFRMVDAFQKTHIALRDVAAAIRRSANVGIGFAVDSAYVRDAISALG